MDVHPFREGRILRTLEHGGGGGRLWGQDPKTKFHRDASAGLPCGASVSLPRGSPPLPRRAVGCWKVVSHASQSPAPDQAGWPTPLRARL